MEHDDLAMLSGAEVRGRGDVPLGRVQDVYFDRSSDRPAWVTVPGEPGPKALPLADAAFDADGRLVVPYDEATVASAPPADAGAGRIVREHEAELANHYGIDYPGQAGETMLPGAGAGTDTEDPRPGGAEV